MSDRKNPRRLIRAIEVATWKIENETKNNEVARREKVLSKEVSVLQVGLVLENKKLKERVFKRIEKRMNEGFIDEVENLLKMGVTWKMQSMNSLGYKEVEGFFKSGKTYEDFISEWQRNEIKYTKRQMTWFKKDKRINWFDIQDPKFFEKLENLVKKWYSSF
jgi:tRNA dimethylallyltransferase